MNYRLKLKEVKILLFEIHLELQKEGALFVKMGKWKVGECIYATAYWKRRCSRVVVINRILSMETATESYAISCE